MTFGFAIIEHIVEARLVLPEMTPKGDLIFRWSAGAEASINAGLKRHLQRALSSLGEATQCKDCGQDIYLCKTVNGGRFVPIDVYGRWHWSYCSHRARRSETSEPNSGPRPTPAGRSAPMQEAT